MFGEKVLSENVRKIRDQLVCGSITEEQSGEGIAKAVREYGNYNFITGGLMGVGLFVVEYLVLDKLIIPGCKKLITKI